MLDAEVAEADSAKVDKLLKTINLLQMDNELLRTENCSILYLSEAVQTFEGSHFNYDCEQFIFLSESIKKLFLPSL